jgi:hypothetical protein
MSSAPKANILALGLSLISGICLIISGSSGGTGIWGDIINAVIAQLGGEAGAFAGVILLVLTALAYLGGITVIIGGILFYLGRGRIGIFFIAIGAGSAMASLLELYISAFISGWVNLIPLAQQFFTSISGIGIVLAVMSTIIAEFFVERPHKVEPPINRFCSYCGENLEPTKGKTGIKCPHCQQNIIKQGPYCPQCGEKIE